MFNYIFILDLQENIYKKVKKAYVVFLGFRKIFSQVSVNRDKGSNVSGTRSARLAIMGTFCGPNNIPAKLDLIPRLLPKPGCKGIGFRQISLTHHVLYNK